MADLDGIYNLTIPAVMSHPHLTEPKAYQRNGKSTGEPKYGASFVFPIDSEDLKGLKAKAAQLAKAKWPGRDLKDLKFPFAAGDKLRQARLDKLKAAGKAVDEKGDFQAGMVVMKSSSKYAPRLSAIVNGKVVDFETPEQVTAHKSMFFFGAEVLAQFNFVPYDGVGDGGRPGVTAYLNLVLATGKGKKLSGGASASEVFKGYVGTHSNEDPTDGLSDDEIPF